MGSSLTVIMVTVSPDSVFSSLTIDDSFYRFMETGCLVITAPKILVAWTENVKLACRASALCEQAGLLFLVPDTCN